MPDPLPVPDDLTLAAETPEDHAAVEALIARAFGPGRHTKVSARVREFAAFLPVLSQVAWRDGALIGCSRMWGVRIGGRPLTFLGPLAVEADQRHGGVGAQLVDASCEAAKAAGYEAVLLVGDLPFFQRCGFVHAPKEIVLPGPVDPRRVLLRALKPGGETGWAGPLTA
ncbi:MAG: N-acetyltransferase [Caulobacteraceae bacterium]|nr:N-acetyltransferase [Caulobacteraceae bacterium]